jgi:hypothetical protein
MQGEIHTTGWHKMPSRFKLLVLALVVGSLALALMSLRRMHAII